MSFLANVHFAMNWFKASGFCCAINTRTTLGLFLDILLLPSCSIGSAGPVPSHVPTVYRWGGCWGGLHHSPGWAWVISGLVSLPALPLPHHGDKFSSTAPLAHQRPVSKGQGQFCSPTLQATSAALFMLPELIIFCPTSSDKMSFLDISPGRYL